LQHCCIYMFIIYLCTMQNKTLYKHADLMGIISAGLCLIHCIAVPVFLLTTTFSAGFHTHAWQWLDYFFIVLAGIAVYFSSKKSSSVYIRAGMWTNVVIFGAALLAHEIAGYAQYISIAASVGLLVLHFLNQRQIKKCSVQKVNAS